MKECIQKWQLPNKNGLKLVLVCGLNWLIRFVAKSQLDFFYGVFVVLLTHDLPQDWRKMTVYVSVILLLIKCLEKLFQLASSSEFIRLKSAFQTVMSLLFFVVGTSSVYQERLSELVVNRLIFLCLISLAVARLVAFLQPRLFKDYLFKTVIHKEYLGVKKATNNLSLKSNFYVDAEEGDADKRMRMVNKNAIKEPYQGIVELSFLNKEVVTGIGHKVALSEKEESRIFEDVDIIYYPIFKVYPLGIKIVGVPLISFRLSRKEAYDGN